MDGKLPGRNLWGGRLLKQTYRILAEHRPGDRTSPGESGARETPSILRQPELTAGLLAKLLSQDSRQTWVFRTTPKEAGWTRRCRGT